LKTSNGISIRMKSKELVIKHTKLEFLMNVRELENELISTIKVDTIVYQVLYLNDQKDLGMKFNTQLIGRMAKRDLMPIVNQLKTMSPNDFLGKDSITCIGYEIPSEAWSFIPLENTNTNYFVDYTRTGLLVLLSKEIMTTPLENQMELMIKNIQKAKKDANLKVYQIVDIYLEIDNTTQLEFYKLIEEEFDNIKERLRSNLFLNQNDKNQKCDEFTKVLQKFNNEYYSYELWI
jgi:hypothetical protein